MTSGFFQANGCDRKTCFISLKKIKEFVTKKTQTGRVCQVLKRERKDTKSISSYEMHFEGALCNLFKNVVKNYSDKSAITAYLVLYLSKNGKNYYLTMSLIVVIEFNL